MTIIRIDTNISSSDIDDAFLGLVTESLASTFQKQKSVSIFLRNLYNFSHKYTYPKITYLSKNHNLY